MHISATIPLILGIIAGILFVGVFTAAWIVTFRNRRKIQDFHSSQLNNRKG